MTRTGPFVVTADDIRRWNHVGNQMVGAGIQIPITEEHQDGAVPMSAAELLAAKRAAWVKYNRGFVKGYRIKGGILESLCDIPDPATFKRLTTEAPFVSGEFNRRVDSTGKDWGAGGTVVTHIALTPIPIWEGQEPFLSTNEVRGGDGAALLPVGKPIKFVGSPARMSAMAGPVRLSMADTIMPRDGQWFPTRLAWERRQSAKGGVKAVDGTKVLYGKQAQAALGRQAKAAQSPAAPAAAKRPAVKEGLREAKIGPGLKFGTRKIAAKGPAKPRAKSAPKAPAEAARATKSTPLGLSKKEGGKLDAASKKAESIRNLPVIDGGGKDSVGTLTVPAFKALAEKIGAPTDLNLSDKQLASAKGSYTKWRKLFPRPDTFAKKIGEVLALDQKEVAKGKTKNAAGASYEARKLALRHMLQFANDDFEAGKDKAPEAASSEDASAADYKRQLNQPRASREKAAIGDDNGRKFKGIVATSLLKHDSPYLPMKADERNRLESILASGAKTNDDRKAMNGWAQAALENFRVHGDAAYPTAIVEKALKGASGLGIGTLTPDEFHGFLKTKPAAARMSASTATKLSNGDTKMADEKESEAAVDDAGADDLFTAEDDAPVESAGEDKKTASDLIKEACEELKELGVIVPDEGDDPEEFLKHLVTAMKTHKATKDAEGGAAGEQESGIADVPIEEQPTAAGVAMSARLSAIEADNARITRSYAAEKFAGLKGKINGLVRTGRAAPAQAKKWLDVVEPKRLSLVSGQDVAVEKVLAQVEMAKENPAGTYWSAEDRTARLSAKVEDQPDYVADTGPAKTDDATINRLSGGRYTDYKAKQAK